MSNIFANAATVLVWLGIEADGSDEAMDAINSGYNSTAQRRPEVEALFRRPYWDRLWIIQEVLMGRTARILCGDRNFSWERLQLLFVPNRHKESFWTPPVDINATVLSLITEKKEFKKQRLSFIIHTFAESRCEDSRDKVYGLLSLVRDSGVIPVDYSKKPVDVFFDTIQRVVQDEEVIDFNSHVDVGRYLRDMMALEVENSRIHACVQEQRGETRKMSVYLIVEDALRAAQNGDKSSTGLLLDTDKVDGDLNAKDTYGQTPLSRAAQNGREDIVKFLLKSKKVNVDAEDEDGTTPLLWAVQNRHREISELLLGTRQVNVNARTEHGDTLLMLAVQSEQKKIVELLLSTGKVDVNAESTIGLTPLLCAIHNSNKDMVELLLSTGKVDVDLRDQFGTTPLMKSVKSGHNEIVELLLSIGKADVNARDDTRQTPLLHASMFGHKEVVELLLVTGEVDMDASDEFGMTPLKCAEEYGHGEIEDILRAYGSHLGSQ
jgi:ankyrin repeat protein